MTKLDEYIKDHQAAAWAEIEAYIEKTDKRIAREKIKIRLKQEMLISTVKKRLNARRKRMDRNTGRDFELLEKIEKYIEKHGWIPASYTNWLLAWRLGEQGRDVREAIFGNRKESQVSSRKGNYPRSKRWIPISDYRKAGKPVEHPKAPDEEKFYD